MIRKLMVAVAVLGLAGTGAIAQEADAVAEDAGAMAQAVSFDGFTGKGNLGVIYAGNTENAAGNTMMESSITWISNFDLAMSGSGTTDGGLTFGAGATIKAGNGSSVVGASNAFIGGESWRITIGDRDPASHQGQSIVDIGFDGLGVDDVAEDIMYDHDGLEATAPMSQGTKADAEVKFTLGTASLFVTAGQTAGTARVDAIPGKPAQYQTRFSAIFTPDGTTTTPETPTVFTIYRDVAGAIPTDLIPTNSGIFKYMGANHYLDDNNIIRKIVGCQDSTAGTAETTACMSPGAKEADVEAGDDKSDVAVGTLATDRTLLGAHTYVPASAAVPAVPAKKQDNQWATGVKFTIGSTTLGVGFDSEKLMQASVGANLGSFSGNLFYSQQKVRIMGHSEDTKLTGMGVQIGVPAGENTTISTAYTQGKTDYPDSAAGMEDKTDKGFGVGVTHILGGGATLEAGFAKVKKQTKASVGVSMEF